MISQGLQEVERGVLASIGVLGRAASGGGPLLIGSDPFPFPKVSGNRGNDKTL